MNAHWPRGRFQAKIRARLGRPTPAWTAELTEAEVTARAQAVRQAIADDLSAHVERFMGRLEELGGHAHGPAGPDEVRGLVVELIRQHRARRVVRDGALGLDAQALDRALVEAGVRLTRTDDPALNEAAVRAAMAEADLGLTGADYGIAETGSVVLLARSGCPRLVSCLPPVHVAVLPVVRLVANLEPLVALLRVDHWEHWPAMASCVTLISGPSRTADIEQTLTIGVHGPGQVHVVLLRADS